MAPFSWWLIPVDFSWRVLSLILWPIVLLLRFKIHYTLLCTPDLICIQSFNQPINHSINQSTNQPINQSTNQPINQSINQSINHSFNQSIIHSIIQSFNHSIIQSFNHSIIQSINQSINQSIKFLKESTLVVQVSHLMMLYPSQKNIHLTVEPFLIYI